MKRLSDAEWGMFSEEYRAYPKGQITIESDNGDPQIEVFALLDDDSIYFPTTGDNYFVPASNGYIADVVFQLRYEGNPKYHEYSGRRLYLCGIEEYSYYDCRTKKRETKAADRLAMLLGAIAPTICNRMPCAPKVADGRRIHVLLGKKIEVW